MLEMLRAVELGPAFANDIIFLFTDGEELGLLGAKAFVEQNALAREIEIVLNFEARGSDGPSIMFETSRNNGRLIQKFAHAARYPYASSLTQALYSALSNDTDFTIFREAGYVGLNFAIAEDWATYHSELDTPNRLSMRSLQHHGSNGLSLVRELGNSEPVAADGEADDSVYFNILDRGLVRYPRSWVIPIGVIISSLLVVIAVSGLQRRQVSGRGICYGVLFAIAGTAAVAVAAWLLNKLIVWASPAYRSQADIRGADLCVLGLVITAVTIALFLYQWFNRKATGLDLSIGCLVFWFSIMWLVTVWTPGASYLFAWPGLFATLSAAAMMKKQPALPAINVIALCILTVPILLIAIPALQLISIAATLFGAFVVAVFAALFFSTLTPQLDLLAKLAPMRLLSGGLMAAAAGLMIAGVVISDTTTRFKTTNQIFYIQDFDKQSAFWMAEDSHDAWTSQFFAPGLPKTEIANYLPAWYSPARASSALVTPAPPADLMAPSVSVVADEHNTTERVLSLRVQSVGNAPLVIVRLDSSANVTQAEVDGRSLESVAAADFAAGDVSHVSSRMLKLVTVRFYALPKEGAVMKVRVGAKTQVKLSIIEIYFEIPAILRDKIHARQPTMMQVRNSGDTAIATKVFAF